MKNLFKNENVLTAFHLLATMAMSVGVLFLGAGAGYLLHLIMP